jgi:hypothetical protein
MKGCCPAHRNVCRLHSGTARLASNPTAHMLPPRAALPANRHHRHSAGIGEHQEQRLRIGQRTFMQRELRYRNSVCRWGAFYVDVPHSRTVVESYSATVYKLQPEQVG